MLGDTHKITTLAQSHNVKLMTWIREDCAKLQEHPKGSKSG